MRTQTEIEPPASGDARLAETIKHFSQRLITAQRSLRLLDALQWDDQVEWRFFAQRAQELPRVTRDDYLSRRLSFDVMRKQMEFQDLERDIIRKLGSRDGAGKILVRMCREYAGLVRLLAYRGTRMFSTISTSLFGSSRSESTEFGLGLLGEFGKSAPGQESPGPTWNSTEAQEELTRRLANVFPKESVKVKLVDRIGADAAAGSRTVKLRRQATYTTEDIRLLEVHEGWVHLGTSLNAQEQPTCGFLRKGPPSSTRTQEGLAVLTEFLGDVSHPARVQRLRQRVRGIQLAEQGADFLQVYRSLHEHEANDRDCFRQTARVFRGSLPAGCGPFTKDLCYVQGLSDVVRTVRGLLETQRANRIPLLFCGKTSTSDIDTLSELADSGLITPPRFVPPPFQTLNAV